MSSHHDKKRQKMVQVGSNPKDSQSHQIPVSLGKPSLRRRLEAYYSLISPEAIQNTSEWHKKFDQIYVKFGGNFEGERRLSTKLAKKYGGAVRLLTVEDNVKDLKQKVTAAAPTGPNMDKARPEEWFQLGEESCGSGVIDFTSPKFDPVAALNANHLPSCVNDAPLLDNLSKARAILPEFDPQRLTISKIAKDRKGKNSATTVAGNNKQLSALADLASRFEKGPLSVLHSCHAKRQRVRVMIRYVDRIRGTLTGYLQAFDKHMNMILRDADEVYSPRVPTSRISPQWDMSNVEMELQRRRTVPGSEDCNLRQRHCKQLLVRGDNVVMVWRADAERSATSRTNDLKSKSSSVGTPGSLIHELQKNERRRRS